MLHRWLLLLTALVTGTAAYAQCGMMGTGGHNHNQQKEHKEHAAEARPAEPKAYASITEDGMQEATVVINDGYHPDTVVAKRGIPLRLRFDLQEESCTGTVVFKEFSITQELAPSRISVVELTPDIAGTFDFSCPMGMIHGTLEVKE